MSWRGSCVLHSCNRSDYGILILLFSVGGISIAIEDTVERALAAEMLPSDMRGTGFGVLAGLNGIGDFISSTFIGVIWTTVSVNAGFVVSGSLSVVGAFFLLLMVPSLKFRKILIFMLREYSLIDTK